MNNKILHYNDNDNKNNKNFNELKKFVIKFLKFNFFLTKQIFE